MQGWGGVEAGDAVLGVLHHRGNHTGDQGQWNLLGCPPTP